MKISTRLSGTILLYFTALLSMAPFFSMGCAAYKPAAQVLPQNIRKISVETFKNSTVYYGMEEKLTIKIVNEFIQDGRLAVVNPGEADGILHGEIISYVLEPLAYDENHVVKEYKLRVLVNISLSDREKNEVVWIEKYLEGSYRFFNPQTSGGLSEEEVREIIWDKLAKSILKRTIHGFGSVTGISEKKVPLKKE